MTGWKTWASGIVTFCTGIAMIGEGILSDPVDPNMIYAGFLTCGGALGIVGMGHKIEKSGK
jgi:hypothetical protein